MTQPSLEPNRLAADVANAIREARMKAGDTVTLSSGIKLKLKPVSQTLLRRAIAKLDKPSVPKWLNPNTNIEEENPNDPDYLDALEEYRLALFDATCRVLFVVGTECESVPEGYFRPEDDGWVQQVTAVLGESPDISDEVRRYMEWIECHAIGRRQEDQGLLMAACALFSGFIFEQEVAEALNSFRGGALGYAHRGVPAEDGGGDGPDVHEGIAEPGDGDGGAPGGEV